MEGTKIIRDLNELHPKVKELAEVLINECKKQGIDIGISETYRSVERQDFLYTQGRTRSGNIVTYVKGIDMASYHQWRLAFDAFNNVKGKEYDSEILKKIGAIGEKLGLEWGGGWSKFKDSPHFQYTFGLTIQDLKNGKRPPKYIPGTSAIPAQTPVQIIDKEYEDAIKYLKEAELLNTFEAWYPSPSKQYFELLLKNIMPALMDEVSYEYHIKILELLGVIASPEIWLKKDFKDEYMKIVLKRLVAILKN